MVNLKEQRILNLGCGNDTQGTDFVDLYPSRNEVLKCDLETSKLPYPDNTFDKILSYGVIGHVTNTPNFLKECMRTLKKGGTLDLLTANAGFWGLFGSSLYGKYDATSLKQGRKNDHPYYLFTITTLQNLLEKYNFKEVNCEYQIANWNKKQNGLHLILIRCLTLISRRLYPHIRATAKR